MTMDRVYNSQQQHGFQQAQQSLHQQPPPPPPPLSQPHQLQQQVNVSQIIHQHHNYGNNQRHLLSHNHHNHHRDHHHHNPSNASLIAPHQQLSHRPMHPPPPPPISHHPTQQVSQIRCPVNVTSNPQVTETGEPPVPASIAAMRNSLPTVPTRHPEYIIEPTSRNSLQQHKFYVNTQYQYYHPSNLKAHQTHQHLDTIDHSQVNNQQRLNHHQQVPLNDDPIVSDLPAAHGIANQNGIHVAAIADSSSDQNSQDHYTEEVIQAILAAKEALEKPIEERDERDILLIDNLCSLVHGFDSFPRSVRRALAAQAVLIVIDEKGKELIVHDEELDSFCVLIFGECEQLDRNKITRIRYYTVGDAFGVCEPTDKIIKFDGHMVTRCENCAFLCVKRDDFITILTDPANYPSKEIIRHRDRNGNVVCISQFNIEKKLPDPLWSLQVQSNSFKIHLPNGHVIVKATEQCLLTALLVDGYDRIDAKFLDDFLLLFRVFMSYDQKDKDKKLPPGMINLCLTLTKWLDYTEYRHKVVNIVLTWLSLYYHDFELNSEFSYLFFKFFESRLLNLDMHNQLNLLHVTLSTKSKIRHVTISRSSREQPLSFNISGGYEKNCGIFVTQVDGLSCDDCPYDSLTNFLNHSTDDRMRPTGGGPMIPPRLRAINNHHGNMGSQIDGHSSRTFLQLRPGDQILEVNGTNFSAIKLIEAKKRLDMSTHLSLTVKYNPLAFFEMRALPEGRRKSSNSVSSASPYPNAGQKFTFSLNDHQHLNNRTNLDHVPPISPLFSANANFGFKSWIKTAPKGDKLRFSQLINSSKQLVKQFRDSAASNTNVETGSKASDNISDDQSNDIDLGKNKSNSDISSLKGKDTKLTETGSKQDDLNLAAVVDSQSNGQANHSLVNVLRVFNAANNDSRYLLIHGETTAREVVMVAVKEFNLSANSANLASPGERTISSLNWHLYEVSVVPESKTIKQKCLSEQTSRLAERASLCSRFYIKNNSHTSTGPSRLDMGDDSLVTEILKENPPNVTLTSLNATLLAVELTLADFDKFRSIEPQQFVYDTFFDIPSNQKKKRQPHQLANGGSISSHDSASLKSSSSDGQEDSLQMLNKTRIVPQEWMHEFQQFADISNKEMFWVICEILNERNIGRRVKIVKQFVRVADVCSQLRNYNSMFAIISGLGHSCVSRLRRTFEKLKPKYKNQLEKMRSLFDPSRNMSNYRICLAQTQPPAIPLFPQIKKDLTFTKEGRSIFVRESKELSDDESNCFSQDTIKRANGKRHGGGDLLSVKSAVTMPNDTSVGQNQQAYQHRQPSVQTRSVSYSSFSNHINGGGHASAGDNSGGSNVLINFAEIRQLTERIRNVIYFSSVPYSNDLLTNTKESQRTQAQIKKMHEEWQMRKRIRHYISQTLESAIPNTQQTASNGAGVAQSSSSSCASSVVGSSDRLDQTDSGLLSSKPPQQQQQNGKLSITYDERTLYQRSLEIEPEIARPQITEHRQLPQHQSTMSQSQASTMVPPPPPPSTSSSNSNGASTGNTLPQVPPTAALLNMQPPPPLQLHHHHHQHHHHMPSLVANNSPTLSKSSSLSSCSSFSQHHLQTNYHLSSRTGPTSVGKFGTESSESLRKLQLLSENSTELDCRSSYSSTNSRDNGLNKIASGGVGLASAKSLISSRIFPPKSNPNCGSGR